MRAFLNRKGVTLSAKVYFIDALSSMALGLFASLIIGLIIKTIGEQTDIKYLQDMGILAMSLMGPAIGVAVAYGLNAPPLVVFSAIASGAAGAALGGPAGSFAAALISTELGKLVSKETKVDIIVTPLVTIASGYVVSTFIGPGIDFGMKSFGSLIMWGTEQRPILMGIIVAVLMGLALTAPISSAAIALMLDLHGVAAGAATIGCAAQMVGFAVSSYRENKMGGLIAIGIGTSMLQVPNIIRNPRILIPPTIAGAILAPFGTTIWLMENNAAGAGMGTSGLVGQIMTFTTMGFGPDVWMKVIVMHIIGPALISLILSEYMRKKGWIQYGDMHISTGGERK
ncbi:PTS transporter subunit IIC [Cytobacillus firmus]|uniref:Putative nicotinate-regulated transporter n=1 Tax=Cytobacillus firmus TaxID=1399 RepID=A0A380Y1K3_CYTFI|nr:PTS sugar transporter subunit IIC [Cytobacillus firmus]KAF0823548.1 putative nicotinate-regulated transporter [Cytobacillus firmus]MBG9542920.1 PTS sugar transporter subunit IIC [Cytobacillus firmus]MBG9547448.1 PTS sugar transporter subunit IIC [Cytobacillus firmus]MBG9555114.1 PTS sugar transporter subunit IIC [Cytobacillus firmus]MBG9558242.1 PTS sugar transporter subunit IIC [Cytobacillus firmus]